MSNHNKISKTDEQWQAELTPEQYRVCRQQGTERPFGDEYYKAYGEGRFSCVCCGEPLFDAAHKYDSGSGWPSFWQPLSDTAVDEHTDTSHGMTRTEVICARCDAHLGHVFPDGPQPTGLRYCINGVALKFEESDG